MPLLVQTHSAHQRVVTWWQGRPVCLSRHALVETYSVLTRLPGDLRVEPHDAARLLSERFADALVLSEADSLGLAQLLADAGVAGGAVYDAIVALAAVRAGRVLATRDARARSTYEALGASVEIVG